MKTAISDKFVDLLVQSGEISSDDKELYEYGLRQGFLMIINIITTIIIGLAFGMVAESLIFMITYIPLRIYAGGYHSNTQLRCYLVSIIMTVTVLLAIKSIFWTDSKVLLLVLFSSIIVFVLSPVENVNKQLVKGEVELYRKKARGILILEILLFITISYFGTIKVAVCIPIALFTLSIMLILGKIKNHFICQENQI